ncbi:MAG: M20 family metallopeptidase [Candidatus Acidiferrales bacterium]
MSEFEKHNPPVRELLSYLHGQEGAMLLLLRQFVEIESPSIDKAAVDRCSERVGREWRERGARVDILKTAKRGNVVRAELALPRSGAREKNEKQILVLGHVDTVYPLGTIKRTPFRISGGRAWGPATFDMKGGLVLALFAVDALRAAGVQPRRKLVFLWTGDEEIGSEASRQAIEAEARKSAAVLVLEPSFGPDGRAKTRRKGTGGMEIVVHGRAAHAGINPEEGINAAHELALQIARLMKMNDARHGITVQANVISGGTVANVVPDLARAEVDVRFSRLQDARPLEKKLLGLRPILRGARVEVRAAPSRPPLERTKAVEDLFRYAQGLSQDMGFDLGEAFTGGGSDGNLTGALGIPTLDGMGAVGDGAHSPRECVVIRALAPRAALIAGLLATL